MIPEAAFSQAAYENAESRIYLPGSWWYATFPGLAILFTVMGFNLLGDGLRDIVDPRLRRSR